ncbi:molecular chaperone DnaJ, partial [Candidatus Parcubacteria bacterium]
YKILEVDKNATKEEIKRAFRKKAHQYHPDKDGGDEEKFKEVNEAYQVLSDDEKRRQYDQFGTTFDNAGASGFGGFSGFGGQGFNVNFEDFSDIFGDFFGGMAGGGRGRSKRGTDIMVDLDLSFKEAVFGVEKEISLTKNNVCERCGGLGSEPGTKMKTCPSCAGQGVQVKTQHTILGAMRTKVTCSQCHGRGEIPETKCKTCGGSGIEYGRKTIKIDIPPGVEDGTKIRVRGAGEAVGGGDAGDLYVHLHVKSDKKFFREGYNIYSKQKIGFTQAALGDTIMTDTVDGKVKLKIPAGTQSGDKLRLKGKGVPTGRGRGDHIVVIEVVTPTKLNRKQKQILKELDLRFD